MSIKVQKAVEILRELNESFRSRTAFLKPGRTEIYDQLENRFNINVSESLLVTWLPEGDCFESMTIVRQDSILLELEVSWHLPDQTTCESIPLNEYKKGEYFLKAKPWDSMRLAIKAFESNDFDFSMKYD